MLGLGGADILLSLQAEFPFFVRLKERSIALSRILAVDFGTKRVGLAATDPLQILASPLTTVDTIDALDFIKDYCSKEDVEEIVVGLPLDLDDEETHATRPAMNFAEKLRAQLPGIAIEFEEEQYTSKMAVEAMVAGGMKKKDRRKKENIDKVSAALILQAYLEKK